MASTIVSDSLNYRSQTVSNGNYRFSKVSPQTPLSSLGSSWGSESVFELSPKVFNLGKSVLSFTATPAGGTTGTNVTFWQHLSTMPWIKHLSLYTKEGYFLADLHDFSNYMKVINRLTTPLQDLKDNDVVRSASGYVNGLHPTNDLTTGPNGQRPTESAHPSRTAYTEAQYCTPGTKNTAATPSATIHFELGNIPFSIFQNKDLYFGDTIYLKIMWNRAQDVLFSVDNAASNTNPVAAAPVAYDGTITIGSLTLYQAIETDNEVANAVMNKYNSGSLSFPVDYVYMNKQSLSGTLDNLQIRYGRNQGRLLKYIFVAPFNSAEVKNTRYDHSVVLKSGAVDTDKMKSLFSTINNERTTQYDINVGSDSWMIQKDTTLKGSAIQSSNEHLYNFSHVENLCGLPVVMGKDGNVTAGMPLDTEILYHATINKDATTNVSYYTFAVASRMLQISPAGTVFS